ncbi:hypothetical protein C0993_012500, partial [Termitomyces sp. T159_Od127]
PGPGIATPSEQPPQLPQAQTATWPTTSAAPGHHCPSLPLATATPGIPSAITAVTATSAPALAITLPMTATSAPALATPDAPLARAKTPVTTCYRPPGLSPGPGTPTLPKPPPRPPRAWTATRPTPLAITDHHRPSTPPATAICGIPSHHWPSPPVATTATATRGIP